MRQMAPSTPPIDIFLSNATQISPDGKFEWNGIEWVPIRATATKPTSTGAAAGAAAGVQAATGAPSIPSPKTKAEFDALPSGTEFIDPTGVRRRKP